MASTELRAAAQQALVALDKGLVVAPASFEHKALRAALAEPQEPVGAVLVNRESREGVMFYSVDMIPDPSTLKDRFELVPVYAAPPQRPAEPVLTVDALRVEFERRYRGNLGITRVEGGAYLSPAIETEWQQFVRKYAAPPQRKPLTEEEIKAIMRSLGWDGEAPSDLLFARAVERAHGIGGEG